MSMDIPDDPPECPYSSEIDKGKGPKGHSHRAIPFHLYNITHYYIIVEISVCLCVCLCVHDQFLTKINFQLFQDVFMVLGGKKIIKKNFEIFF